MQSEDDQTMAYINQETNTFQSERPQKAHGNGVKRVKGKKKSTEVHISEENSYEVSNFTDKNGKHAKNHKCVFKRLSYLSKRGRNLRVY